MSEISSARHVIHPASWSDIYLPACITGSAMPYAEIQVSTNFTFLTGASHPEQLVDRAVELGYHGLAITDTNSLAGIVRMHAAAKQAALPLAIGCRLVLAPANQTPPINILVYPTDRSAYGQLCQLLTRGKMRVPKGQCHLTLHDLFDFHEGMLAVIVPPEDIDNYFVCVVQGLKRVFGAERLSIAASLVYGPDDRRRLWRFVELARHTSVPLAATNNVQYHCGTCKPLHDVLACIRHRCTLDEAGFILQPNAEQHLKSPGEMYRIFSQCPAAIERSLQIVRDASSFNLDQLRYEYPHDSCPRDKSPMQHLAERVWQGASDRYEQVPEKVKTLVEHELKLIEELNYPHYFLAVYDIVKYARAQGILCQGRGAAANSAVCFCLGITEVDPDRIQVLFERFVSKERDEPPDIDVDFEHERREQVIQYIYRKYGRHRAALTAEVITYRRRSAIREVGKVLGLSLDCVNRLAENREWLDADVPQVNQLRHFGLNPGDPILRQYCCLIPQIMGFPRYLSQHVGGFVLTQHPLSQTVPIENAAMSNRTVIEWDKDDIDTLHMLKVDVLGLGMLTCIRKSFELIERHHGRHYAMCSVPSEDPAVYEMICKADTIGVFQIESRAQMSMLPRLRPKVFYDLVIEVAIVRPGPIQGGMVHPYLRRRTGEEDVQYPSEVVKEVLGRTLGVPLFQEQAMALVVKTADFTAGEADALRRSMATWKCKGHLIKRFENKIINGMLANGYEREFSEKCFNQIKGFSGYGFPESHAASFALIVYVSAWLKCFYPAAFSASLINSQPMGFYAPSQIIQDAKDHGVEVRPIDVNHSQWDCTLEHTLATGRCRFALRLGMRLVKSLKGDDAGCIAKAVKQHGPFRDPHTLRRMSQISTTALRHLASADAFGSMGLDRQQSLWQIRQLHDESLPLFDNLANSVGTPVTLPRVPEPCKVLYDYASTGLSLKAHPVCFLRSKLDQIHAIHNADLVDPHRCPHGRSVVVGGLVLVRQRPGTASGIVFMTIEDETGVANLIVRARTFARYRRAANHGRIILARGTIERDSTTGQVVHVMVQSIHDISQPDIDLRFKTRNFH